MSINKDKNEQNSLEAKNPEAIKQSSKDKAILQNSQEKKLEKERSITDAHSTHYTEKELDFLESMGYL